MQQWLPQNVTFMSCMKNIRQISIKEKTRKEIPIKNQTISINVSGQHTVNTFRLFMFFITKSGMQLHRICHRTLLPSN